MYRVCTSAENVIYILFRVTAYLVLEHGFAVYRCEEFPMDSFAPNLSLVGICGSAGRNYREYFFFFFQLLLYNQVLHQDIGIVLLFHGYL